MGLSHSIYVVCMSLIYYHVSQLKIFYKKKKNKRLERKERKRKRHEANSLPLLMQKLAYLADFAGQID